MSQSATSPVHALNAVQSFVSVTSVVPAINFCGAVVRSGAVVCFHSVVRFVVRSFVSSSLYG